MATFIKVIIISTDGEGTPTEEPSLLNIETVESFRVIDGKIMIYYINKDSKTGSNWTDTIKGSALELVTELLAKNVTVLK